MVDSDRGHQPIFIRHLHSACTTKNKLFTTLEQSTPPLNKVSIHGIVVRQQKEANRKYNGRSMWLDDSTGVIRLFLSPRLCCRPDMNQLVISSSVSVFGTVDCTQKGEIYIKCGGFHVDHDPIREIYHWIRVIEANKLEKQKLVDKNHSGSKESPLKPSSSSLSHTSLNSRFHTLMSQPSPPGSQQIVFPAPKQQENNNNNFLDDFDSQDFTWSPDHPFASSTPISRLPPQVNNDIRDKHSPHEGSPLRYPIQKAILTDDDDDDDEFGFDDSALDNIDFDVVEQNALGSRKRNFDDALKDN